jgi:phosphoribosylformimino-5-aminoimidazole carboxamide ribotide isomerase
MQVIPALDLLDGKCVRLRRGDYEEVTVYSDQPIEVVARFVEAGAHRVHVVDLDAARDRPGSNQRVIQEVVRTFDVEVQVAGGIRAAADVETWLDGGADYVVVGTMAAETPGEAQRLADAWPGRMYVALDTRGDLLATHGWRETGEATVGEMLDLFEAVRLAGFVYTDIARDGTMAGPDLDGLRRITAVSAHPVILSGGMSSHEDLRLAATAGAAGVILGRAMYEETINLGAALSEFATPPEPG